MKKMKFIASVLAMSLLSSLCIGSFSASAATGKSLNLVYDSENSTATEKYINAYYQGFDGVIGAAINVNIEGATATGATFTYGLELGDAADSIGHTPNVSALASGKFSFSTSIVAMNEYLTGPDNLFGTFKFVVPEGTEEFTVSIEEGSNITDADWEAYDLDVTSVTIPGAKPADETVAATSVGTFNEWTEEAAVAAFTATLTAEQAAKTVTWNVTDGTTTKTQATTVDTTISGENDVVIGLMVKNAVAGLSASVVVK